MSKVKFFRLTQAQYDALASPDADTIYFITDTKAIYLGTDLYAQISETTSSIKE